MSQDSELPFLTIVMPVFNEGRFIEQTLAQLLAQNYPPDRYEILVVDGMSTDDTREITTVFSQQHPNVFLLDNPKQRSSAGRNVGFKAGRGGYFLVVDGHCFIPTCTLLSDVADCFARSGADCLGRPQPLDPPGLTPFQQAVALARGSRLGHGSDSMIYGDYEGFASPVSNGAVYGKSVFEKIGYVDETFDACEDVDFNYRVEQAGFSCYTSLKLAIQYYPRENMRGFFRQMVRYGEGRFRFIKKHREALTFNQLVPSGFVAGLMMLIMLLAMGLSHNRGFWGLGVLYGIYALIVIVESLRLAIRNDWKYLRYLPQLFFAIHFGLGWGFLNQLILFKKQRF